MPNQPGHTGKGKDAGFAIGGHMALSASVRLTFARWRAWARGHGGELLWALIFAVVVGVPAAIYSAWYFIELPPYKIYLVAGSHYLTEKTKHDFGGAYELKDLSVDDVPVQLVIVELADDKPETAKSKAQDLANDASTLLVIGHFDSEPTEASLKQYFTARPQIPFIASVQTDDDLLSKACPQGSCYEGTWPLPYIQLSPTNAEQAHWAIQYAAENGRRHFVIVESDASNTSYSKSLAEDYKDAITKLADALPDVTKHFLPMNGLTNESLEEEIATDDIDCLLYAGGFDDAPSLVKRVWEIQGERPESDRKGPGRPNTPMVILDDSVVENRLENTAFKLSPVNITNQRDAEDYKKGINVYGLDAIAIATELVRDMRARGLDRTYRLKSIFHLQTGRDVRRNLVRVMRDNFYYRSSYYGAMATALTPESRTVYAFKEYARANGMFHVWERAGDDSKDVDQWHPRKTMLKSNAARGETSGLVKASKRVREF
jgi:hypothetical protein